MAHDGSDFLGSLAHFPAVLLGQKGQQPLVNPPFTVRHEVDGDDQHHEEPDDPLRRSLAKIGKLLEQGFGDWRRKAN